MIVQSAGISCGTEKAPALTAQRRGYKKLRNNQEHLKSESYYKLLTEQVVRETEYTVTMDSQKVVHKTDLLISLGEKSSGIWGLGSTPHSTAHKVPKESKLAKDPRKEAVLQAIQERMGMEKDGLENSGAAQNRIILNSSPDGLTPISLCVVNKISRTKTPTTTSLTAKEFNWAVRNLEPEHEIPKIEKNIACLEENRAVNWKSSVGQDTMDSPIVLPSAEDTEDSQGG